LKNLNNKKNKGCNYGEGKQRRKDDSGEKTRCQEKGRQGHGEEPPSRKENNEDLIFFQADLSRQKGPDYIFLFEASRRIQIRG
jgi:hypothetical protein